MGGKSEMGWTLPCGTILIKEIKLNFLVRKPDQNSELLNNGRFVLRSSLKKSLSGDALQEFLNLLKAFPFF